MKPKPGAPRLGVWSSRGVARGLTMADTHHTLEDSVMDPESMQEWQYLEYNRGVDAAQEEPELAVDHFFERRGR